MYMLVNATKPLEGEGGGRGGERGDTKAIWNLPLKRRLWHTLSQTCAPQLDSGSNLMLFSSFDKYNTSDKLDS